MQFLKYNTPTLIGLGPIVTIDGINACSDEQIAGSFVSVKCYGTDAAAVQGPTLYKQKQLTTQEFGGYQGWYTPTILGAVDFYVTRPGVLLPHRTRFFVLSAANYDALFITAPGAANGLIKSETANNQARVVEGTGVGQINMTSGLLNAIAAACATQVAAATLGATQASYVAAGTVGSSIDAIRTRVLSSLPSVAPGAANGLLTLGTGTGQITPSAGNVDISTATRSSFKAEIWNIPVASVTGGIGSQLKNVLPSVAPGVSGGLPTLNAAGQIPKVLNVEGTVSSVSDLARSMMAMDAWNLPVASVTTGVGSQIKNALPVKSPGDIGGMITYGSMIGQINPWSGFVNVNSMTASAAMNLWNAASADITSGIGSQIKNVLPSVLPNAAGGFITNGTGAGQLDIDNGAVKSVKEVVNLTGTVKSMGDSAISQIKAAVFSQLDGSTSPVTIRTNALQSAIEAAIAASEATLDGKLTTAVTQATEANARVSKALPDAFPAIEGGLPLLDADLNVSSDIDPAGIWGYKTIDIQIGSSIENIGQLVRSGIESIQSKTDLLQITPEGDLLLQVQGVVAGSISYIDFINYMNLLDLQRLHPIHDIAEAIQIATDKLSFINAKTSSEDPDAWRIKASLPKETGNPGGSGYLPGETVVVSSGHIDTVDSVQTVSGNVDGNISGNVNGSVIGSVGSMISDAKINGVDATTISSIQTTVNAIELVASKMTFASSAVQGEYDLKVTIDDELTSIDNAIDSVYENVTSSITNISSVIANMSSIASAVSTVSTNVTAVKERTDMLSFAGDEERSVNPNVDLKVTLDSETVNVGSIESAPVRSIWNALLTDISTWNAEIPSIGGLIINALPAFAPDEDGGLATTTGTKLDSVNGGVLLQSGAVTSIWAENGTVLSTAAADALAAKTRVEKALPDVTSGTALGVPVLNANGLLDISASENDLLLKTDFDTAMLEMLGTGPAKALVSMASVLDAVNDIPTAIASFEVDSLATIQEVLKRLNAVARGKVRMTETQVSPIGITWYDESDQALFSVSIDGRDRDVVEIPVDYEV